MLKVLLIPSLLALMPLTTASLPLNKADVKLESPKNSISIQKRVPIPTPTIDLNMVRLIHCGSRAGTAFHIGNGDFVTAYHVVGNDKCVDVGSGTKFQTKQVDENSDFAIIHTPSAKGSYKFRYNCFGYITGRTYFAIGWAEGTNLFYNRSVATMYISSEDSLVDGLKMPHLRKLIGTTIQGMSGGPVADDRGIVYGMNSVTDEEYKTAWSRQLKDTPLCRK